MALDFSSSKRANRFFNGCLPVVYIFRIKSAPKWREPRVSVYKKM